MTAENKQTKVELLTLDYATGPVGPTALIEKGLVTQEGIHEMAARIANGEYTLHVDPGKLPEHCVDPRIGLDGPINGTKAAGGYQTLVQADALTNGAYMQNGEKAPEHAAKVVGPIVEKGKTLGGHLQHGEDGPCGAIHKLHSDDPGQPSIYRKLVESSRGIFGTLRALGVDVSEEQEAHTPNRASGLIASGYFTGGKELEEAGRDAIGAEHFDELPGPQTAVMVVLMTKQGEVLDQQRIFDDFGSNYRIFELETWSVANGAEEISMTPDEANDKTVAGLAYNVATTAVIVGKDMPILVN